MKEVNNVLIPAEMNQIFPIICHVNIFSFIKKLENHRQILILKFKDIQNEIRFILHKWEKEEQDLEKIKHVYEFLHQIDDSDDIQYQSELIGMIISLGLGLNR